MPTPAQRDLLPAAEAVRTVTLAQARNRLRYGTFGELETTGETLQRIIEAVPPPVAALLKDHVFLFVPLAIGETTNARDTEIARLYTPDLADRAICHRTVPLGGATYTFISTRLMQDRFALAFEVFINVGHQFVDALLDRKKSLPEPFTTLLWTQALGEVRGETSQDAYEARKRAIELHTGTGRTPAAGADGAARLSRVVREKDRLQRDLDEQRARYFEAALADALAIYMLSLAIDLEYADLREREYPLLAAPALADRLKLIAEIYPPPAGYEFAVRYRRRH